MIEQPELFDVIELLMALPDSDLQAGAEGTIVEILADGVAFLVEFTNDTGECLDLLSLKPDQFIVVWKARTGEPVPVPTRVAEVVAQLPETAGTEVLDFARFLSAKTRREKQLS